MQLLTEAEAFDLRVVGVNRRADRCSIMVERTHSNPPMVVFQDAQGSVGIPVLPAKEPDNLIYPSLSGRAPAITDEQVRKTATSDVSPTDYNLVSRYATLSDPRTPHGKRFAQLCERVLSLNLSLLTSTNGQRIGTSIGRSTDIGLESMGTGVATVLGLLINLTEADGKIFLIEEPENDLHPQALKALLDVIVEESVKNQFIITTHSNIVLTRLGALEGATVIEAVSDAGSPPTSTFELITGKAERLRILRDFGYELADLGLGWGWLIFEESSAERLCRDYLIKWFAPSLLTLNTMAAQGAGNVPSLAQNLIDMMKFAHLEPAYRFRAWVLVDGDRAGIDVVNKLHTRFPNWPVENFAHLNECDLESYYPGRFADQVARCRALQGQEKREAKRELLESVLQWVAVDETTARAEFKVSAAGLIEALQEIESQVRQQQSE